MRAQFKKIVIAFMVLVLIGNPAAGATTIKSEKSSVSNSELLSSVTPFAGSGDFDYENGAVLDATFRKPQGVAILEDGTVIIADSENHLIRQIKNGQVTTYAGITLDEEADGTPSGGWNDGVKETAVFNSPTGIDTDLEGNIYIADQENHSIRKIAKDGTVSTIAGDGILGHEDGVGSKARFYKPQDVAVAADGTLYVADTLNHVIRRITKNGQVTTLNAPSNRAVEVVAGDVVPAGDYADGKLSDAKFNEPTSIAIDKKGNLYVSDTGNHVIRYIDLAKGTVSTVAGVPVLSEGALYGEGGYKDGDSKTARFYSPRGIAITEEQGLVIADSLNHTVRYLLNGQVSTIAGVTTQFGHVDGINGHNLLHQPSDVAVLPDGSLLIADSYNNKIRKLDFYKLPSNLPQNNQVKVVLENQMMSFDTQPEITGNRTMVPVRALSEKMGYEVVFEVNDQTIELTKGDIIIKMQIGSSEISIENAASKVTEQLEMDVAPYAKSERTYVPLRFFSEAFGMDVEWDSQTNSVILREITEPIEKQPLADRYERTATLKEIKGTVWINQAGGSLTYRAYDGILLHHGDHIMTEFNSSAVLVTADRKDEITIGENAKLYISNLSSASHVKHTSFHLWSGDVAASVTSLVDSNDTFKIMTTTAVVNVRGTHLMVGVDPVTGESRFFLASGIGIVQAGGNGTNQNSVILYPLQQVNLYSDTEIIDPMLINLVDLIDQASPAIIEAIIKSMAAIERENLELLERMKNGDPGSSPGNNPIQGSLEQYENNLNNLLANIMKEALDKGIIDEQQAKDLIDEVNKGLDKKIDLNNVPPHQLTDQQRQQQERAKQLEEERKKKEEQKRLNLQQQNADVLAKIQAAQERQRQENIRAAEEAKKKAEESYKQQLLEEERQKFEQRKQVLEQQKKQQEAAQPPAPIAPTPVLPDPPPPPVNRAPVVNNSIADRIVTTEDSIEINISEVFSDPDGDALTYTVRSSNPEVAEATIDGALVIITSMGLGDTTITITANDGKGGETEGSFRFRFYGVIEDLRAEAPMYSINLYWDPFGDYAEGELEYHIYLNGELFRTTPYTSMSFTELEPNTTYSLRVLAFYEGKMIAFGDYDVTTMPEHMDDIEPIELD